MGNQPSTPSPTSAPVPAVPIPVCNSDCQRQKQLSGLLLNLQTAEQTKTSNPEAYEKARIDYYTLKDGQEWLAKEKEKLAKQEIEPVLKAIDAKYELLQSQLSDEKQKQELVNLLKAEEVGDEEESRYLKQQLMKEQDKVGVSQRLSQLGPTSILTSTPQWLSIAMDVVLAVLSLLLVYSIFKKVRYTVAVPNTIS